MTESAPAVSAPAERLPTAQPSRAVPDRPGLRLVPAPQSEPPYDDERRPVLRLVTPPASKQQRTAPLPPQPETLGAPDARPFAVALVQRLLEVCGGVRPVTQLRQDTTLVLYAQLERALGRRARPAGARPTGRDVHSVHVQQRPDGVAEVCATVRRAGRLGAVALRLERSDDSWVCTQLQGL